MRAALLAALLAAPAAAAAARPLIHVEIGPCLAQEREQARRIVAAELGALLTEDRSRAADTTRVFVRCDDALIELSVDDPITGKSLARSIDLLAAPPESRARLLALAVAELVAASWTELELGPGPAALRRPSPPPSPAAQRAAMLAARKRAPSRGRVLGLGSALGFFSGIGVLWGGGVRAGWDHGRHLGWTLDALVHHGEAASSLGPVAVDLLAAGAMLLYHHEWTRVQLRAGGGLRLGAVQLGGRTPDPPTVRGVAFWGLMAGPMVAVAATVSPLRRLALEIGIEGGYNALPVVGLVDGAREVAVAGPWIGVQAGIGVAP